MVTLKDARNRQITFDSPPRRVVSLIPSITESLFDLGLGDRVAGISKYCIYPEDQVASKTRVGGQKNPDFEAIEQLKPDLLILNEEENKGEHIDFFCKSYRTFVTYPRKFIDAEKLLTDLGEIFNIRGQTDPISASIRQVQSGGETQVRLRTMFLIWRNPWMSINSDTFIHDVLHLHGLENVFSDRKERYFEVTESDMMEADPEVIILPNEPYNFLEKHIAEFKHLKIVAVKTGRIFLADGTYFCWYGTRMARTHQYIKTTILDRLQHFSLFESA